MSKKGATESRLKKYIPIVDFLAAVLGKNSEVVLHDLRNLDRSVIAIRNGHVSNREVGAPATDLVLKVIKKGKNEKRDFIANYKGIGKFNKPLRSSTYFIRDDNDEIIGMICVNTDEAIFEGLFSSIRKIQENFMNHEEDENEAAASEKLSLSIEEVAQEAIREVLAGQDVAIEYLKQEEKLNIIKSLHLKGIFLMKGAVVEIAKALGMSEASVYRYVQIIKRKEEEK